MNILTQLLTFLPVFALLVMWSGPDLKIGFTLSIFYLILRDMFILLNKNYTINYYLHKDRLEKIFNEEK